MKKLLLLVLLILTFNCQQNHPLQKEYPESISISISNPTNLDLTEELFSIQVASLIQKNSSFNPKAFVVIDGQTELSSQLMDENTDGNPDKISFLCDLKANQSKKIKILFSPDGSKKREYTQRTQAEISHKVNGQWVDREYIGGSFQNTDYLAVPPEHTDHSWYIRYEGPGWESDKVGYRFYMDWRNAVDVFGKKTSDMVLQNVGQDGYDSYHEMSDWGMDILKVGSSLGLGSIATWVADSAQRVEKTDSIDCRIVASGPIQSVVKTNYWGWQIDDQSYDLKSTLTINGGSRLTRCDLVLNKNPANLCTGIVKHDSAKVMSSQNDGEWQFLATYGKQSLNNDNLGMAVFYKTSNLEKLTADKHSQVVVLKPTDGKLTYYFLAAWEHEPNGIKAESDFNNYLEDQITKLNNPIFIQ